MVIISEAEPSESQKIRKLEERVWEKGVTSPYDAAAFAEHGYTFVAKDNNEIIGAIVAFKTRDNKIRVVDWIVDEKHRKRGIGFRLYNMLMKSVDNAPLITLVNSKNKTSIEGHKKLGFRIIKEIRDPYHRGRSEHAFLMERAPSHI